MWFFTQPAVTFVLRAERFGTNSTCGCVCSTKLSGIVASP